MSNPFANKMTRMLDEAFFGNANAQTFTTAANVQPVLTKEAFLQTIYDFKRKVAVPALLEWVVKEIPGSLESLEKDGHTAADVESWMLLIPELPEEFGFTDRQTETHQTEQGPVVIRCSKYTPSGAYLVPLLTKEATLRESLEMMRRPLFGMEGSEQP